MPRAPLRLISTGVQKLRNSGWDVRSIQNHAKAERRPSKG
jgi:hypothetical protein